MQSFCFITSVVKYNAMFSCLLGHVMRLAFRLFCSCAAISANIQSQYYTFVHNMQFLCKCPWRYDRNLCLGLSKEFQSYKTWHSGKRRLTLEILSHLSKKCGIYYYMVDVCSVYGHLACTVTSLVRSPHH